MEEDKDFLIYESDVGLENSGPSRFQYQHEFHSSSSIRLLKILSVPDQDAQLAPVQCEIAVWDLQQPEFPEYNAISYTWGDIWQPQHILVHHAGCEGQLLTVGRSCEDALISAWQYDKTAWYWIDSICICQGNNEEKQHQIPMMGTIYGKAKTVLACLGPHADGSKNLFRFVRRNLDTIIQRSRSSHVVSLRELLGQSMASPSDFAALGALLDRSYFSRVWVFQEIYLAQRLYFCCGQDHVSARALWCMARFPEKNFKAAALAMGRLPEKRKIFAMAASPGGERMGFDQALTYVAAADLQSQYVQDRIFGILGVVDWKGKSPIVPDYNLDVLELTVKVVNKILETRTWILEAAIPQAVAVQRLLGLQISGNDSILGSSYAKGQRTTPSQRIPRTMWPALVHSSPMSQRRITTGGLPIAGHRIGRVGPGSSAWYLEGFETVHNIQVISHHSSNICGHKWRSAERTAQIMLPKATGPGDWCLIPGRGTHLCPIVLIVRPTPFFQTPILYDILGLGFISIFKRGFRPHRSETFEVLLSIEDLVFLVGASTYSDVVTESSPCQSDAALNRVSEVLSMGLCGQQGSSFAVRADWWTSGKPISILNSIDGIP